MRGSGEASPCGVCRARLVVAEAPAVCRQSGRSDMDCPSGGDLTGGTCRDKYPTRVL